VLPCAPKPKTLEIALQSALPPKLDRTSFGIR
jgi:hypothetical protein